MIFLVPIYFVSSNCRDHAYRQAKFLPRVHTPMGWFVCITVRLPSLKDAIWTLQEHASEAPKFASSFISTLARVFCAGRPCDSRMNDTDVRDSSSFPYFDSSI